jgi:hypothetical protein
MPAASAASSATAATAAKHKKKVTLKQLPNKFLPVQFERQKLEHELTNRFPTADEIKFKKVLELLMMNGFVCRHMSLQTVVNEFLIMSYSSRTWYKRQVIYTRDVIIIAKDEFESTTENAQPFDAVSIPDPSFL